MKIIHSGCFHAQIDDNQNAEIFSYEGSTAKVVVPDHINGYKVTKLGENLFCRHEEIQNITLPETIETVGKAAFFACTGLKKPIVLAKNLREIGDMSFGYYPLSLIQFPPGLEIIKGAFKCAKLTHISLPESVKEIGYEAFCHTLIESVEIPNGVTILNSSAFDDCSNLRQVSIGAGVQDFFKYGGFRGCSALENICVSPENEYLCDLDGVLFDKEITRLIKYPAKKSDRTYIVPETVTNICSKAFEYARVKKVICPAGLKQISDEAFYGSSLKHINIPNGIECVEITHRFRDDEWDCFPKGVFYQISYGHPRYEKINGNLAKKRIASTPGYTPHDTPEKICGIFGYREYFNGTTITRILEAPDDLIIPETLDGHTICKIEQKALGIFSLNCPKRIYLPKTIQRAFTGDIFVYWNDLIESIEVADDNPYIFSQEGVLFQRAEANAQINKWTLPGEYGLTLACYPMRRCTASETYRIPDGTEKIGEYAFYCTHNIKCIIIPPSVKLIYRNAFRSCQSLEEVLIEDGCEAIIYEFAFSNNDKLTKIAIPESITQINDHAVDVYKSALPAVWGSKDSPAEYFAVKNKMAFVIM